MTPLELYKTRNGRKLHSSVAKQRQKGDVRREVVDREVVRDVQAEGEAVLEEMAS